MRMRYLASGRVQGVGFRATTRQIASRYAVTGFVRNLPDGTVEIVMDGSEDDIAEFRAAVQTKMASYLTSLEGQPVADTEPFKGFTIRR